VTEAGGLAAPESTSRVPLAKRCPFGASSCRAHRPLDIMKPPEIHPDIATARSLPGESKLVMTERPILWIAFLAAALVSAGCAVRDTRPAASLHDPRDFATLMGRISTGWNTGDAAGAADCFTEDAVYLEPPDRQQYQSRSALFEFFGGRERPPPKMSMVWHHLAFDAATQTGFGEYTFEGNRRYHGIVVVKLRGGKVSRWREYQQQSPLSWEEFVGPSRF
jgi:hypothetical protein